ncbi:hypothetical protein EJ06DRAFT_518367 [Trichodelitschia bisporula]|uniref:Uncharacterized protein n=1 Tax=Trichodelitschia bisporula TaxID=703511 RepID=A0A6G1IB29_9PEZI|nr:hypothetical protein EJ06DRAFT_518367 [Trichodelitschia bisporula]
MPDDIKAWQLRLHMMLARRRRSELLFKKTEPERVEEPSFATRPGGGKMVEKAGAKASLYAGHIFEGPCGRPRHRRYQSLSQCRNQPRGSFRYQPRAHISTTANGCQTTGSTTHYGDSPPPSNAAKLPKITAAPNPFDLYGLPNEIIRLVALHALTAQLYTFIGCHAGRH